MTDLAERIEEGWGSRIGRLLARALLTLIIVSPIGVGFWLAPKADDMPAPPELAAPPQTGLPDAVMRVLPSLGSDQSSDTRSTTLASGG